MEIQMLDECQEEAKNEILSWFVNPSKKKFFTLAGRAGTGKSTIVKSVVEHLGLKSGDVSFVTPTGKAALVLQSKGISSACTVHSLIYIPKDKKKKTDMVIASIDEIIKKVANGEKVSSLEDDFDASKKRNSESKKLEFRKKPDIGSMKLIICDEASMLNDKVMDDLESYKIPVVYIGDHHQLPPVEGINSKIAHPDYTLEKIFRQAEGNGIIKIASHILDSARGNIPFGADFGDNVFMENFDEFLCNFDSMAIDFADEILCGTNALRIAMNRLVRKRKGFGGDLPNKDERIICLKNNYDIGVVNGLQGYVRKINSVDMESGFMDIEFEGDDGSSIRSLRISLGIFIPQILDDSLMEAKCEKYEKFDFGYAITVHKSEGSEWDNVLYIESKFRGGDIRAMHYTAVTRASKRLVIIKAPTILETRDLTDMAS
jgi:exodeoxyribonuclease V